MNLEINKKGAVEGIYGLTIIRNAGKPNEYIEKLPEFKNLILDGFFTRWAAGQTSTSMRFFVGTSATPPANTDTALISLLGVASGVTSSSTVPTYTDGVNYFSAIDLTAQWGIGQIVGNISEIGGKFSNNTTNTALDTRSLIKDNLGNPTTITLTADDQLVVNYRFIIRLPIAQDSGQVVLNGVTHDYVLETLNVNNAFGDAWGISGWLSVNPLSLANSYRLYNSLTLRNDVTANLNSGGVIGVTAVPVGTTIGTTRRVTVTANASQFNIAGGINYIALMASNDSARQGIQFTPNINKTSSMILILFFDYTLTRA